jgi:hypothetical protein
MKIKALRDKDTKEFIHIMKIDEKFLVFTGDIPNVQPMSATMELMKEIYPLADCEFDNFDNFELVEYHLVEVNTIGADIRNKLTPCLTLASLVEAFLSEEHPDKKNGIKELIWDVLEQNKKSVKYIANLL